MKLFKKVLLLILAVLPAVYTAIAVLCFLPDTVAAHFGIDGTPDRYGSKYEAFILPGIVLILYCVYLIIGKYVSGSSAQKSERAQRNQSILDTVMIITFTLFNAVCIYILLLMGNPDMVKDSDNLINAIISTVIGILFIVMGNILPKTKRNSFIGMRLSFAMDTDEHWYIANRAGGVAMVISGLVTVIGGLIVRSMTYLIIMCVALLVTLVVAIIYSYVKIKGKKQQ